MKTTIIAGFPGIGKSFLKNKYKDEVSDSDSSKFNKDEFPDNYIQHIKSLIGKKRLILVSTHKEVLKCLEDNNINYILVYPNIDCKDEYIKRYEDRGSDIKFIELLNNKWDEFHEDLKLTNPLKRIILKCGEYLQDKIENK